MSQRIALACLLGLLFGSVSPARADDCCPSYFAPEDCETACCCNPCCDIGWTLTAEALWLQRGSDAALASAAGATGPPVDQAFAGNQFRPGVRLGLTRRGADGNFWEVGYFGLNQWAEDEAVLGDPILSSILVTSPSLRVDDIIGGFNVGVAFSYRAQTHNAEINRWWSHREDESWSVRWMLGMRYFNFEEQLTMAAADTFFGAAEFMNAAAYNYLAGGQMGLRLERTWDRFGVYALGKAGLYGNAYRYRLFDTATAGVGPPLPDIDIKSSGIGVAGLLETQIGVRYRVLDWAYIRGGYNLYYVPGVALQPTSSGAAPNHSDGLLLHGASVGFELTW